MNYNIAVIGGGPGGYVAAIYASKHKAKVALIEEKELGGTCLNVGCIPTKALIHSASLMQQIKEAERFGIISENIHYNWDTIQKNVKEIVKSLTKGVESLLKANGVSLLRGTAKLLNENTIKVTNQAEQKIITAEKIIIATGSTPIKIPIPGNDFPNVITSEQALFLEKPPLSITIIGGGAIGLEIGYIFNSLGVDTTIIEMLPEILPGKDEQLSKQLRQMLVKQGIKIYTNSKVKEIKQQNNYLTSIIESKEVTKAIESEYVLMAVGRKPNFSAIEDIAIQKDKTGIAVDDYLKTNIENVFAIGDVTGKSMLAHVASHQGIIAASNALNQKRQIDYTVIPSCIYTKPEMASVGLTEQQARQRYKDNIKVGIFPLSASGKAKTLGYDQGMVKIVSDAKYNQILGVHILGQHAIELIAEACIAIRLECTAEELANTIHAHPTLSESIMEAAFDLMEKPIHKL